MRGLSAMRCGQMPWRNEFRSLGVVLGLFAAGQSFKRPGRVKPSWCRQVCQRTLSG